MKGCFDFVFSLGAACSCTTTLRMLGIQDASYPFDWLYGASFAKRCDFLYNNFENFISWEDLEQIGNREAPMPCKIFKNKLSGIVFNHDFPLAEDAERYYEVVKEKYNRRINRLYSKLETASNSLLVYIELPNQKPEDEKVIIEQFCKLRNRFKTKLSFLYLSCETGVKPDKMHIVEPVEGGCIVKCDYADHSKNAEVYAVDCEVTKRIVSKFIYQKSISKLALSEEAKLVSVIIPAYNHESYIQDTIKSIINQTYRNLELLIIDDGSTDNTFGKIAELESLCSERFVRFNFSTQENRGTTETINSLILNSKGEYVYLIASDDIAKPDAIDKEVKFLSSHKDYALCVGDNDFIDQKGNKTVWNSENCTVKKDKEYKTFARLLEDEVGFKLTSSKFSDYAEFYKTNFVPNGYLIRKSIFENFGLFRKEAPLEDWWLMLQISKYAKLKFLNEILFSYRLHPTNTAKQRDKIDSMAIKTKEYENRLIEIIPLDGCRRSAAKFIRKLRNKQKTNIIGRLKLKNRIKVFGYSIALALAQIPVVDLLFKKKRRQKLLNKIMKYWR